MQRMLSVSSQSYIARSSGLCNLYGDHMLYVCMHYTALHSTRFLHAIVTRAIIHKQTFAVFAIKEIFSIQISMNRFAFIRFHFSLLFNAFKLNAHIQFISVERLSSKCNSIEMEKVIGYTQLKYQESQQSVDLTNIYICIDGLTFVDKHTYAHTCKQHTHSNTVQYTRTIGLCLCDASASCLVPAHAIIVGGNAIQHCDVGVL